MLRYWFLRNQTWSRSAHFVTEFLNRVTAPAFGQGRGIGEGTREGGAGGQTDSTVAPLPGNEELWNDVLPEIVLVTEDGETVHASH